MHSEQVLKSAFALAIALNSSEKWDESWNWIRFASGASSRKKKVEETIKNEFPEFWNPNLEQQNMIKSWSEDFREKMQWVLTFHRDTTTILINWVEMIFENTKIQTKYEPTEDSEEEKMSEESVILLMSLFENSTNKLKEILNLKNDYYFLLKSRVRPSILFVNFLSWDIEYYNELRNELYSFPLKRIRKI